MRPAVLALFHALVNVVDGTVGVAEPAPGVVGVLLGPFQFGYGRVGVDDELDYAGISLGEVAFDEAFLIRLHPEIIALQVGVAVGDDRAVRDLPVRFGGKRIVPDDGQGNGKLVIFREGLGALEIKFLKDAHDAFQIVLGGVGLEEVLRKIPVRHDVVEESLVKVGQLPSVRVKERAPALKSHHRAPGLFLDLRRIVVVDHPLRQGQNIVGVRRILGNGGGQLLEFLGRPIVKRDAVDSLGDGRHVDGRFRNRIALIRENGEGQYENEAGQKRNNFFHSFTNWSFHAFPSGFNDIFEFALLGLPA